jgi:hypothetical protein
MPTEDKDTVGPPELQAMVGLEAASAYRILILGHKPAQGVTLFQYDSPPSMQDRIVVTQAESTVIDRANRMRDGTGVPFWEAIFATCGVAGQCSDAMLTATFFHNGQGLPQHVSRDQISRGILETTATSATRTVALGSLLLGVTGPLGHLNFVDFHCAVSKANQEIVHRICQKVMPRGFLILDSGGSYHACSATLVSNEERVRTLAMALLASPIVDARYVAHQLLQASSSIRISPGGKLAKTPIVVDAWEPSN